jgi:hypothetical protein
LFCNCDYTLLLAICTEHFKDLEVLSAVSIKIPVLEDAVPCSLAAKVPVLQKNLVLPCSRQESYSSYQKIEVAGSSETLVPVHKTMPVASPKPVMSELYV